MKKKLLFFVPFLICGLMLLMDTKPVKAEMKQDSYSREELPKYPYRATQTTSYQNRFKWYKNKIYTKVDYGTWVKPGKEGKLWIQAPHPEFNFYCRKINLYFYNTTSNTF